MIEIIRCSSFILLTIHHSRKDSPKLSSDDRFLGHKRVTHPYSHDTHLASLCDISLQLHRLICNIIKFTYLARVCHQSHFQSKIDHHLCHMRSDKIPIHIGLLDRRHRRDTNTIGIHIRIIILLPIGRVLDRTSRNIKKIKSSDISFLLCPSISCIFLGSCSP